MLKWINKNWIATSPAPQKKAGGGDRTRVASLEGWCFTTKQHPHTFIDYFALTVYNYWFPSLHEVKWCRWKCQEK
jgi:hypothetical protein